MHNCTSWRQRQGHPDNTFGVLVFEAVAVLRISLTAAAPHAQSSIRRFCQSVSQSVSPSVRLQSIRTDCLAVGEERGDREGERASEEYLSHGTKGRRMMTPSRLGSEQPTMRRAGQRGRERVGERAASRRWTRGGASPSSPVAGPHTSILWRHPGSAFIPNGSAPDLRTVPQPLIFLWNEYLCKCGDPLTGALALPFPLSLSYPDPIIHKSPIVVWMRAACRGGTESRRCLGRNAEENGQRRRRDLHAMCSEAGKNAVTLVEKERLGSWCVRVRVRPPSLRFSCGAFIRLNR